MFVLVSWIFMIKSMVLFCLFIPLGDVSDSQNIAQNNSYERCNTA